MQCAKIFEMPIPVNQIDLWRQSSSEHQRLEFKEAKTQFGSRKLCKYCVAMANEGGGHLLLGIAYRFDICYASCWDSVICGVGEAVAAKLLRYCEIGLESDNAVAE
jgi:hypothetical protein